MSSYVKKFDPAVSQMLMSVTKKSLSLSDISSLTDLNGRLPNVGDGDMFNLSTETIGSNFGKDSGYVHSASVSSLNSSAADYFKTHGSSSGGQLLTCGEEHLAGKVNQLLKELEDRKILIAELEKSNLNLRLQCAAAQSKITELRIKCEEHCRCCSVADVKAASSSDVGRQNVFKRPFQGVLNRPSRCSSLQSLNFRTSTPVNDLKQRRNVKKITEWRSMLVDQADSTDEESPLQATTAAQTAAFPSLKRPHQHSFDASASPIPCQGIPVTTTPLSDDDSSSSDDEGDDESFSSPLAKYPRTFKNRKEEMENIIRTSWNDIAQMGKMSEDSLSSLYRKQMSQNFAKGTSPLLMCLYEASHIANDLTNGLLSLELSLSKVSDD